MPHSENHLLARSSIKARELGRKPLRQLRVRTTFTDRFLLMTTIILLPLQNYFPTVGGASLGFILFVVLGGYLALWSPTILLRTSLHPVFLAGYTLIGIGLFFEFAHDSSGFSEILRICFMILGGVLVASLCRDQKALLFALYGTLVASGFLAVSLFTTTYGYLSSIKTGDFQSSTEARAKAFSQDELGLNLNTRAFLVTQGVVVALALALTTRKPHQRFIFITIASFYSIASLLTMSRGGLVILVLSCAAVLYANGIMQPKVLIVAGILSVGILLWVPDAVFSRFTFSTERQIGQQKVEARARVYGAAIKHMPEYVLVGKGISHFYGDWGMYTGFAKTSSRIGRFVVGTHNCFVQVTVYWGLAGLLALLVLVWQAYRCIPDRCGQDSLRLCLLGIAVAVLLESLVVHTLYAKEFSLALGMLVGGGRGVLSHSIHRSRVQDERLPVGMFVKNRTAISRLNPTS